MSGPYTLHGIFLSGPTYKAGLMLKMLGQSFAYRHVDLRGGAHKKPEFLKLNRYGQVPALQDGDLTLCQSDAILLHLAEKHGKMGGRTVAEKARAREWLFWEFDRLAPNVYRLRAANRGFAKFDDATLALYKTQALDALKVLEGELASRKFLAGDEPTVADVAVYGDVVYAGEGEAGLDLAPFPNVKAWMARFAALPGFKLPSELLPQADAAAV